MIGPGQDMPQASTFIAFIEGMTEEAVIGAQRREWSKFIDEKNEFVNFNFKKVDDRVMYIVGIQKDNAIQ